MTLRLDLALEHVQGAPDEDEHGVGHNHRIVGIEPAGALLALFQRRLGRLVDHVVGEGRRIEREGIHGLGFGGMDRPRELLAVDDEDLVVAAQFAEARPRHVGELNNVPQVLAAYDYDYDYE